jgi:predicted Zn-ribbon and HTH transcriptional regulator
VTDWKAKVKGGLSELGDRLASNFEQVKCPSCEEWISRGDYQYLRYCPRCETDLECFEAQQAQEEERRNAFIQTAKRLGVSTEGKTLEEISDEIVRSQGQEGPASQAVVREVYKEREVIREIVKIRCRHCGTLFEEKLDRCPHCGAGP